MNKNDRLIRCVEYFRVLNNLQNAITDYLKTCNKYKLEVNGCLVKNRYVDGTAGFVKAFYDVGMIKTAIEMTEAIIRTDFCDVEFPEETLRQKPSDKWEYPGGIPNFKPLLEYIDDAKDYLEDNGDIFTDYFGW